MSEPVVITSYGLVSPIGLNAKDFEKNLFAGVSGVRALRGAMVPPDFPVPYAAWIDRESLPISELYPHAAKTLKSWLMTEAATRQALQAVDPALRIDAVIYGTADGASYEIVEDLLRHETLKNAPTDFDPATVCSQSSLETLRRVATSMGFSHVNDRNLISVNGACASGNQTIGLALEGIRSGRWDRCLVGGVDARCEPSNYLNFYLLGALSTADVEPHRASRPFSKDRSGFVRGEGAAVLMLESRTAAEARGATILGVVSGYGCTSDAYRLTDGREDVASVTAAMRRALTTAQLGPEQIDYINAHGTSTPLNDRLETVAIKAVFGARAKQIPISSIKSQIGHSTIASSAIEAIACLMMLKHQTASPTINCDVPDPECDLDYVPHHSRAVAMKHVMSNSFGFGGQNSCVVFSSVESLT